MIKYLTAKQKADELGITTNGLAKTRHLYKHIKKSPRKYLYFEEDAQEVVRPNMVRNPLIPVSSRSNRRRNVEPGQENYHKAPGGSGRSLQVLNQMRAKASLEGNIKPEDLKYLDEAMALKIKENAREIVEQKRRTLAKELEQENLENRKKAMAHNPIQNMSNKGYPYTTQARGHDDRNYIKTNRGKTKEYKYYW